MLEIIPVADPKWDTVVKQLPHDVYHLRSYHDLAEKNGNGRAFVACYRENGSVFGWPFLLRDLMDVSQDPNSFDVTSVYGYPGPSVTEGASLEFVQRALDCTFQCWREQGVVSVFTRFSPFLENHLPVQDAKSPFGAARPEESEYFVSQVGRVVGIDLQTSEEELFQGYDKILRQNIRRGLRAGLTMTVDETWEGLDQFLELYYETMEKNQAPRSYYVDSSSLRELKARLKECAHLVVLRAGPDIACMMIVLEYGSIGHAHLAGSSARFAELSPLKVLIHQVALWAQGRNLRFLDLGGGRGGSEDSLFQFKKKFSHHYLPFYVGRWVLDRDKYDDLCRRKAFGDTGQAASSYFPRYRVPSSL